MGQFISDSGLTELEKQQALPRKKKADNPRPAGGLINYSNSDFVEEFCKMTSNKKAQRDNAAEKKYRKDQASCYYKAAFTEFIASPRTMDEQYIHFVKTLHVPLIKKTSF